MTLRCLSRYKTGTVAYRKGQLVRDLTPTEEAWLLNDSPDSFERVDDDTADEPEGVPVDTEVVPETAPEDTPDSDDDDDQSDQADRAEDAPPHDRMVKRAPRKRGAA